MNGKLVVSVIVLLGLVAGVAIYYLQVYHYYADVPATGAQDVTLITLADGTSQPVEHADFTAINADSSPIRYRACFTTPITPQQVAQQFVSLSDAEPRNAPGWFSCFDATAIGVALKAGKAQAFLAAKNIHFGVDRIIAITEDGHGYIWHDLNECGTKAYDGTLVGEACPDRPK